MADTTLYSFTNPKAYAFQYSAVETYDSGAWTSLMTGASTPYTVGCIEVTQMEASEQDSIMSIKGTADGVVPCEVRMTLSYDGSDHTKTFEWGSVVTELPLKCEVGAVQIENECKCSSGYENLALVAGATANTWECTLTTEDPLLCSGTSVEHIDGTACTCEGDYEVN